MPPKNRVTQRDVALRAGVHRTTVALALKKHPSIPKETQARIARLAETMGYVPDPMLSALAAYRSAQRPAAFHGTLVWLVNSSDGYDWRSQLIYRDYHDGATAAARRYGYKMEVVDLAAAGMTPGRASRMLQARNVTGLLLCPQPRARMEMDFPWERFSAVTFGYTLEHPRLHTVTSTQYRNAALVIHELRRRGYRRIGFAFHDRHDARTDHNYLGSYLAERQFMGARLEPLLFSPFPDYTKPLRAWLRRERPDAIMTGSPGIIENLARLGLKAPEDIGVAIPGLRDPHGRCDLAGVNEEPFHTGEVAVDFLVAMIQRNERGIPAHPQRIHVEGTWIEGNSLRPSP